jgi:hypothetical protein
MDGRAGRPQALLGEAPRSYATRAQEEREEGEVTNAPDEFEGEPERHADLGDLVVALLASTLAGLRDRLFADGFEDAAELVDELVEITDDYICRVAA